MDMTGFQTSSSGVRVEDDFRSNLIIDRYDPVFAGMRASKIRHLRSENSEDAITWNAFRTLRQISPATWMPKLTEIALPSHSLDISDSVVIELWRDVAPPPSLLQLGDEGISEIDVAIESAQWVWFIEVKYKSDISTGTTTRPSRNQVLRNIDVGSYYAGVRSFYFSLLILDSAKTRNWLDVVEKYQDLELPRRELRDHRPDGLKNLMGVTWFTWADLTEKVLKEVRSTMGTSKEAGYLDRLLEWLGPKGIAH